MILIDGSSGEGGGQILRTCLALSIHTGQPFRIERIRARRRRPGLMRQHLAAVRAAQDVSGARVRGGELGSQQLDFEPAGIDPKGEHRFDIGSAGSSTLVAQTVLPPLLLAGVHTRLTFCGGTHNPMAPPYDFLAP